MRADDSVVAMGRVEARAYRRLKPYMNDEQREALAQRQRDLADRIEQAAAAE